MSVKPMKQENFEINENKRKKIIRQDRVDAPEGKIWIQIASERLEVINYNAFGLAVLAKTSQAELVPMNTEITDASVYFQDREIQKLKVKLVRKENHPTSVHNDVILGTEVIGEPFDTDQISAIDQTTEMIANLTKESEAFCSLPGSFKNIVLEMKDWLDTLKKKIDNLEKNNTFSTFQEQKSFQILVIQLVGEYLQNFIPPAYRKIPMALTGADSDTHENASKYIKEKLGPYIYGAPFANRAYSKPLGYAGDYEMMNHLYRNEGEGISLFDKCMHRYFIDEPAGQAVKNRGLYLCKKLEDLAKNSKKKIIRVACVASGPAREVQLLMENAASLGEVKFEFHFFDQDEESLKHAQKQISAIDRFVKSKWSFNYNNLAIKNIIGRGLPNGPFDFVYSAGLFDYFTEPVATVAAERFYQALSPNSQVIIGNFSKDNPSSVFMEMALDWHLIYRSKDDLRRIFEPVSKNVEVEMEPLGINLFAVIKN